MHKNTEKPAFDSQTFLKNLTTRPGIYRMFNLEGELIYVGKAKNLKNRVSSYYKTQTASPKQTVMMTKVTHIDVTVKQSVSEALLLECQYIKRHKPRYNICLRDDKTFPLNTSIQYLFKYI
jgi:excinuclease ABC subunit C